MKRKFERPSFQLMCVPHVSIGILWIVIYLITLPVRAESTPAPERKVDDNDVKQTGEKQGGTTSQVEKSGSDNSSGVSADIYPIEEKEIVVGYAKNTTRSFYEEDNTVQKEDGIVQKLLKDVQIGCCGKTKGIIERTLKDKKRIATIVLSGDAEMHSCFLVAGYVGFLKADKIIFIYANGERQLTVAMGNVKFLSTDTYITADCACQEYENNRVTFETFEDKVKIADKDKVKIRHVQTSINKIGKQLDKVNNQVKTAWDLNEAYDLFREVSEKLLENITKDEDIEDQDTILSSIFVYDRETGAQKAEGGVRFKIYRPVPNPDTASENSENETEED